VCSSDLGFIDPHVHPFLAGKLLTFDIAAPEDWNLPSGRVPALSDRTSFIKRVTRLNLDWSNESSPHIVWGWHPLWHGKFTRDELDEIAEEIYFAHWEKYPDEVGMTPDTEGPDAAWRRFIVYPWDEKPGLSTLISAVKKEIGLLLVLFGFISLTAVFLVLAIFWSMVAEKTRDIGVLRAVGASRAGVAWLFVRYGLVIGIVGVSNLLRWLLDRYAKATLGALLGLLLGADFSKAGADVDTGNDGDWLRYCNSPAHNSWMDDS